MSSRKGDLNNDSIQDEMGNMYFGNQKFERQKKNKKSKTGYMIGLIADILATVLFVYLAIKISLLFFISLVITVPIGIYCLGILCGCCLSFGDRKIKIPGVDINGGHFYSETCEPENELNQNQGFDFGKEKPVKIYNI